MRARFPTLLAAVLAPAILAACSSLLPTPQPPPARYTLDDARVATAPAAAPASAPTLRVNLPHAAAGHDSAQMIYLRQPQQLESYTRSVWADTPARMLAPMMSGALTRTGAFAAVVAAPGPAAGDLQLDTEILRLQQDFTSGAPSKVRFSLRATLLNGATRRVIAVRDFDAVVPASSEDAAGGVTAAQRAVQQVLDAVAAFCADAARARLAAR
jgi:cholesterol transport system auxiliary component